MFIIDNLSVLEVIFLYVFGVTPCAGVWIEIAVNIGMYGESPSLPVRECGLKFAEPCNGKTGDAVTPCAGVWIEMSSAVLVW